MTEMLDGAKELDNQLADLLSLTSREDFADLYDGDIDETRKLLKKHLVTVRVDIDQIANVEKENFFPGNPIFEDIKRKLDKDIHTIGVDIEFDIYPQLESTAKQLAEKAKQEAGGSGLLQQAIEAIDKALAIVQAPVTKAVALAMAIKTILDLLQGKPG